MGRTVAKSIDGPATIEGEVVALLYDIVEFRHQLAVFKRFGVIDDCMPYTLQEIGEMGFEDNIPITRERVRQIEAQYLSQLKNSHFFLKKCSIVESFLNDQKIISLERFCEFISVNGYSNALNPLSLVERLRGFGVMSFSHKPLRVNWLSLYFSKKRLCDHFENLFNQLRRSLTGSIFWHFNHYQSSAEEESCRDAFLQELKNIPSLFLYDENGRQIIAKTPIDWQFMAAEMA